MDITKFFNRPKRKKETYQGKDAAAKRHTSPEENELNEVERILISLLIYIHLKRNA